MATILFLALFLTVVGTAFLKWDIEGWDFRLVCWTGWNSFMIVAGLITEGWMRYIILLLTIVLVLPGVRTMLKSREREARQADAGNLEHVAVELGQLVETGHAVIRNEWWETHREEKIRRKTNAAGNVAVAATGAYTGAKLVLDAGKRRRNEQTRRWEQQKEEAANERRRDRAHYLASQIKWHATLLAEAQTEKDRGYHHGHIAKMQAELASLQVK